jgi:hypothetical protein
LFLIQLKAAFVFSFILSRAFLSSLAYQKFMQRARERLRLRSRRRRAEDQSKDFRMQQRQTN